MRCHHGDFAEYFAICAAASPTGRRRWPARAPSARRAAAAASLERLQAGDVIRVPAGRRAGLAVVLDPGVGRAFGEPRPLVLTEDRWAGRIVARRLPDARRGAGPGAGAASTSTTASRRRAATSPPALRDTGIERARPRGGAAGAAAAGEDAELAALRRALRAHPCHGCPDREEHARWAERRQRLERDTEQLRDKVRGHDRTRWPATFDRVCALLGERGYLRRRATVTDGRAAARRGSGPRPTCWSPSACAAACGTGSDPAELAAAVSAVVYESPPRRRRAAARCRAGAVADALERDAGAVGRARRPTRPSTGWSSPASPTSASSGRCTGGRAASRWRRCWPRAQPTAPRCRPATSCAGAGRSSTCSARSPTSPAGTTVGKRPRGRPRSGAGACRRRGNRIEQFLRGPAACGGCDFIPAQRDSGETHEDPKGPGPTAASADRSNPPGGNEQPAPACAPTVAVPRFAAADRPGPAAPRAPERRTDSHRRGRPGRSRATAGKPPRSGRPAAGHPLPQPQKGGPATHNPRRRRPTAAPGGPRPHAAPGGWNNSHPRRARTATAATPQQNWQTATTAPAELAATTHRPQQDWQHSTPWRPPRLAATTTAGYAAGCAATSPRQQELAGSRRQQHRRQRTGSRQQPTQAWGQPRPTPGSGSAATGRPELGRAATAVSRRSGRPAASDPGYWNPAELARLRRRHRGPRRAAPPNGQLPKAPWIVGRRRGDRAVRGGRARLREAGVLRHEGVRPGRGADRRQEDPRQGLQPTNVTGVTCPDKHQGHAGGHELQLHRERSTAQAK